MELNTFCKIVDTIGPENNADFTSTGDLQEFMEWFESPTNYYKEKVDDHNKVHVITHSHIMRDYLAQFKLNDETPFNIDKIEIITIIGKKIRNSSHIKKFFFKYLKWIVKI